MELELFGDNNRLSNYTVDSNGALTLNIASGEDVSLSFRITNENATGGIGSVTSSSFSFKDSGVSSYIDVDSRDSLVPGTSLYKFTYKPSTLSTGGSDSKFVFTNEEKLEATTDYFLVIREPKYNGKYLIPHSKDEKISGYSSFIKPTFSVSETLTSYSDGVFESDGYYNINGYDDNGGAAKYVKYSYSYQEHYNRTYRMTLDGTIYEVITPSTVSFPAYTYSVCKPYIITGTEIKNNPALWSGVPFDTSKTLSKSGSYYEVTLDKEVSHTSEYKVDVILRYEYYKTTDHGPEYYDNPLPIYGTPETHYSTTYTYPENYNSSWDGAYFSCNTNVKNWSSFVSSVEFASVVTAPISYNEHRDGILGSHLGEKDIPHYFMVIDYSHDEKGSSSTGSTKTAPYLLIPTSGENQCIVPYYCPDPKQAAGTKHSGTLTIIYTLADGTQKAYNVPVVLTEYDILTIDERTDYVGGGELAYSWDKWEKITVEGADGKNYNRWILKDN